jgi:hypothetical protein
MTERRFLAAHAAALLCVSLLAVTSASAHHSFAKFDRQRSIELEGELVEVRWQNPHVQFTLRSRGADGQTQTWRLETNSPGILRRTGVGPELVTVGERVKVAGNPAVDGSLELNATNMLLADGRELSLGFGGPSRFAGRAVGDGRSWTVAEGDKTRPELGLFRVWSSTFASAAVLFTDSARPGFTVLDYPLTAEARRAVQAFDSVAGSRRLANDCTPKGMPWIMEQPYDLEFSRSGGDVVLNLEEFDVQRQIYMEWNGDRAAQPFTPHGFSTGAWQDRTLVVTTTNLSSPNFKFEVPASDQAAIVERFTPTVAGDRLDYEIVVTDPVTFTEPVKMAKYWLSVPGQVLDVYNCGAPLSQ